MIELEDKIKSGDFDDENDEKLLNGHLLNG